MTTATARDPHPIGREPGCAPWGFEVKAASTDAVGEFEKKRLLRGFRVACALVLLDEEGRVDTDERSDDGEADIAEEIWPERRRRGTKEFLVSIDLSAQAFHHMGGGGNVVANLYVCGFGLAITKFVLQVESGGWQGTTTYQQNKRHRFRARFENSFRTGIPMSHAALGNTDIYIADVGVELTLQGAVFDGQGPNSGRFRLMPYQVGGHPDFNDTIAPQTSRWFEFGYFRWATASKPANTVVAQILTHHRFVSRNMDPAPGNIQATAA